MTTPTMQLDTPPSLADMPVHPAANLFPMLGEEELDSLARDIQRNGLREPVWTYDDPERGTVLLDGRNRLRACQLIERNPGTPRQYDGDDPIAFVMSLNLERRHLTLGQRTALGDEALKLYEEESRKRMLAGKPTEAEPIQPNPELVPTQGLAPQERKKRAPQSREKAAKAVKVSSNAMRQWKRIAEQAPDLAEKVKSGVMALDRAERIIRDREAEQRRVEEARKQAEAQNAKLSIDLRCGDFRDVLNNLANVDAIITDPPYGKETLHLLTDLATWADQVLAPDGVMAVLMGQLYLPEVYERLSGGRPYRWTACYLTPGNGYASHTAHVQTNWKPLLIYGAGPRFTDIFRSEGTDAAAKDNHKWGQDYMAFHSIVERLTRPLQTVVDPFMGSGTSLLAAHALGRHVIGADTEHEYVLKAMSRLGVEGAEA